MMPTILAWNLSELSFSTVFLPKCFSACDIADVAPFLTALFRNGDINWYAHINRTFDAMSAETQYIVACEFGYPKKLVKEFLEKKRYENAGELVYELEDYLLKCEKEKEDVKPAIVEEKIVSEQHLSDLEEAKLLYKKSICLVL